MSKQRVMITIDGELLEYLESKSKSYGIPKSAVFMMALGKMKEQDEVVSFMSKLSESQIKEALEKKGDAG